MLKRILLLTILLSFFFLGYAQFNLSTRNGLPDDHVYNMSRDQLGYLWFTTPKGIVKYNGYELKVFSVPEGTPVEDIWLATIDKRNRIWLSMITNQIGYIQNDRYHQFHSFSNQIYPIHPIKLNNGIAYISTINNNSELCIADSVFITLQLKNMYDINLTDKGELVYRKDGFFRKYSLSASGITDQRLSRFREREIFNLGNTQFIIWHSYAIYYKEHMPFLWFINLKDTSGRLNEMSAYQMNHANIDYVFYDKDKLYILKPDTIYIKDSNLNTIRVLPLENPIIDKNDRKNITYALEDSTWGNCISTATNGVYIDYKKKSLPFKQLELDLNGYHYVGKISDSIGEWWNGTSKMLAQVTASGDKEYFKFPDGTSIAKIIPYNSNKSIVISTNDIFLLNNNTKKLTYYFADSSFRHCNFYKERNTFPQDLIITDKGKQYAIFHGMRHLSSFTPQLQGMQTVDTNIYNGIAYNKFTNTIIAFNRQRLLIIPENGKKIRITDQLLNLAGIKVIESIFVDSFGHILLKDYDKLWLFDNQRLSLKRLFRSYRLINAQTTVTDNNIVVAACNSGLLFTKVFRNGSSASPVIFENIKNVIYRRLYDINTFPGHILLNTDNGVFSVKVPESFGRSNEGNRPFRLIASYNDRTTAVNAGDTLVLNPATSIIRFDVINPYGTGNAELKLDKENNRLVNKTLDISDIKDDLFTTISIVTYDNFREDNPINFVIYKKPYWWEMPKVKVILWLVFVIIFYLAVIIAAKITGRIWRRKQEEKNHLLRLELRSIYANLNPHFIFNTLGLIMHYIRRNKMTEAYEHVSKFSQLLRAYINNSQSGYILLSEEIKNIRNYVQLQLARFDNKFDFYLDIDAGIDTDAVEVPTLLLQPIVENAINHGLFHKTTGKGLLSITISRTALNEITFVVEDDGVGREYMKKFKAINDNRRSHGNNLLNELISSINKHGSSHIEMQIIDKESPLTGTIVKLRINNAPLRKPSEQQLFEDNKI